MIVPCVYNVPLPVIVPRSFVPFTVKSLVFAISPEFVNKVFTTVVLLFVNIIPVLFSTVLLCIAFKADAVSLILAVIFSAEFILFMGIFGLFMNLKRYNLTWTNEIVPVKQGLSVLFSMLMGWAVSMVMGIALFGFSIIADVRILSAVFVTVFALADCLLLRNLKTKGTRLFEEIS